MDILLLLIPLSLVLVGAIAWFMLWAAKSGQFDDLEGGAQRDHGQIGRASCRERV